MTTNWVGQVASIIIGLWMVFVQGAPPPAQTQTYLIVAPQSTFSVFVGRAGLLKGFGHNHTIAVESFSGRVQVPVEGIQRASVELEVETKSLRVADKDISEKERAEIQAAMHDVVLETSHFPKISFRSVSISNGTPHHSDQRFTVLGDLTLHGVTKRVAVPVVVTITPDRIRATGEVLIKQTDFGIKPYSAALGSIKVKDTVKLRFEMIAKAS